MSVSLMWLFITTFFFVSLTPGLCMTLSMSLGMSIGVKRALWMMVGELLGVGLVAFLAVIGAAAIMLQYPTVFQLFKYAGGGYLIYLGVQMWCSKGKMALESSQNRPADISRNKLFTQGFITAIANPKAWAFFIALLPPFIDESSKLEPQLLTMISLILLIEFLCLLLYACGGRALHHVLQNQSNVSVINRIAGSLMMLVGVWLAMD